MLAILCCWWSFNGVIVGALKAFDCGHENVTILPVDTTIPGRCPDVALEYLAPVRLPEAQIVWKGQEKTTHVIQCLLRIRRTVEKCEDGHNLSEEVQVLEESHSIPLHRRECQKLWRIGRLIFEDQELEAIPGRIARGSYTRYGSEHGGENHTCQVTDFIHQRKLYHDAIMRVEYELLTRQIKGTVNIATGEIEFTSLSLVAEVDTMELYDPQHGTLIWGATKGSCISNIETLYSGEIIVRPMANITPRDSLINAIVIVNNSLTHQYAGLIIKNHYRLCGKECYSTHIRGLMFCPGQGEEGITFPTIRQQEYPRLLNALTEIGLLTMARGPQDFEAIYQHLCRVSIGIIQNKMRTIMNNPDPLTTTELMGKGYKIIYAGAALYIVQCVPIQVEITAYPNCTLEIPAMYRNTTIFVDPASRIVQTYPNLVECSELTPSRWRLDKEEPENTMLGATNPRKDARRENNDMKLIKIIRRERNQTKTLEWVSDWYCAQPVMTQCKGALEMQVMHPWDLEWAAEWELPKKNYDNDSLAATKRNWQVEEAQQPVLLHFTRIMTPLEHSNGPLRPPLSVVDMETIRNITTHKLVPLVYVLGNAWHYMIGLGLLFICVRSIALLGTRICWLYQELGCGYWMCYAVTHTTMMLLMMPLSIWRAAMINSTPEDTTEEDEEDGISNVSSHLDEGPGETNPRSDPPETATLTGTESEARASQAPQDIGTELRNLRQLPHESLSAYMTRAVDLMVRAHPDVEIYPPPDICPVRLWESSFDTSQERTSTQPRRRPKWPPRLELSTWIRRRLRNTRPGIVQSWSPPRSPMSLNETVYTEVAGNAIENNMVGQYSCQDEPSQRRGRH